MSNISKKKVSAGGGMFKTEIETTCGDTAKNETPESIEAVKGLFESMGSGNVFQRHVKRFKALAERIIEDEGGGVKEDQKELVITAKRLLDEISLLAKVAEQENTDHFFIANQAMNCMNLYHQCATRLFFEIAYRKGEAQQRGHKTRTYLTNLI